MSHTLSRMPYESGMVPYGRVFWHHSGATESDLAVGVNWPIYYHSAAGLIYYKA